MSTNKNKILLILDLDETLIHATHKTLPQKVDFMIDYYSVYQRPHLSTFLQAIKDDFRLAVWSSASDDYVTQVVEQIFPKDIILEFIWARSRCTYRRNFFTEVYGYDNSYNYDNHYEYVKPLKKLKKYGYRLNKMLIVDDTPFKCQNNYGNAIYPRPFIGDTNDKELLLLTKYLKTLKDCENVRSIEKRGWWHNIKI